MADFNIKQGDTRPFLTAILAGADGVAVNLTGATVVFNLRGAQTRTVKVARAGVSIVNALAGQVRYVWTTTATDTAGDFLGEFEVTFSGGSIETFPNATSLAIHVEADLG